MTPMQTNPPVPVTEGIDQLETLRQAFARQPRVVAGERFEPPSLTVAVSREAGSRGGTIARRVGRKLGWQVYQHDLLEYLAQEGHLSRDLFANLDEPALEWVEQEADRLRRECIHSQEPAVVALARVILAIAARGEAVIVGRGAGYLLPAASTVHVRVIAPLEARITYMSQIERLTLAEASAQVHLRDQQRTRFMETHLRRNPQDMYHYDLVVNSQMLGEELSAELIAQAAHAKLAVRGHQAGLPPAAVAEPLG